MVSSELGYEVGAVLGGVDCEGLRDRQQGGSELGDGELFSRALMGEINNVKSKCCCESNLRNSLAS